MRTPIKTKIKCKDSTCPANVNGMCGPAKVRNMYKRRLEAGKKLPLWKQIFFWFQIRKRALMRAGEDIKSLDQHARLKSFMQGERTILIIDRR